MQYFLKNLSNDLYLSKNTNKSKTLIFRKKSKFGSTKYKTKVSSLFLTKKNNKYFSKKRQIKIALSTIKAVNFSVENGFFFELSLVGLGYKVTRIKYNRLLEFELHFSHRLYYKIPKNVAVHCVKKRIILFSIDKPHLVNATEQIKALRLPNTYKGKGIRYVDEIVKLKPGKQR